MQAAGVLLQTGRRGVQGEKGSSVFQQTRKEWQVESVFVHRYPFVLYPDDRDLPNPLDDRGFLLCGVIIYAK